MLRKCHACRLAGRVKCRPNQGMMRLDTISGNCLPVIVLAWKAKTQQRRGLVGITNCRKKAVIHNIFVGRYLIFTANPRSAIERWAA